MVIIINNVDLRPLNDELEVRPRQPKYLIMSEDTRKAIDAEYRTNKPDKVNKLPECVRFDIYKGIPIAICNAVPFGYIDIKD